MRAGRTNWWLERFWAQSPVHERVIYHMLIVCSEWALAIQVIKQNAWHVDANSDVVYDHDQGDGVGLAKRGKHENGFVGPVVGRKLHWQVQPLLDPVLWREKRFGRAFLVDGLHRLALDLIQLLL